MGWLCKTFDTFWSAPEKWFHDLSSQNKFSRQWRNKIFWMHMYKIFPFMCIKKNMISTSLLHCAQSSFIIMSPCLQKIMPATAGGLHCSDLGPTHEALNYHSHHVLTPQLQRAMSDGLGNWALKATIIPSSTAEMHTTQAVSYRGIRLRVSVFRRWALRIKILILFIRNVTEQNF